MYLIYNYYNNLEMLKFQVENWNKITDPVTIVVVDDCSAVAAESAFEQLRVDHILYRITDKSFLGGGEARNVGVMATIQENQSEMIFMSDIDIVVTPENYKKLLQKQYERTKYYKFRRTNSKGETIKTHMNTYVIDSAIYWKVQGFDCDYVGTYGGDSEFLDRVRQQGIKEEMVNDIVVTLYDEKDIKDANCLTYYNTTEYGNKYRALYAEKAKNNNLVSINPIRRKYEIVSCKKS